MMPVTLQLQPQRVVFWGRMKRQIVTKHKSRKVLLIFDQTHTVDHNCGKYIELRNIRENQLDLFPCDIVCPMPPTSEKRSLNNVPTDHTDQS